MAEEPYLRQSWYHVLVTACRRHSAALLESCPGCRQPLSHHRGAADSLFVRSGSFGGAAADCRCRESAGIGPHQW
ncbi:hypothetical protein D0N87_33920 [Pseudomonas sp. ATCC 13867]|nr:hypothetical protein D0N87_33920 [Pseudomonas sp. ATCC 13867]